MHRKMKFNDGFYSVYRSLLSCTRKFFYDAPYFCKKNILKYVKKSVKYAENLSFPLTKNHLMYIIIMISSMV